MERAATIIQMAWKANTFTCDDCGETRLNRDYYGDGYCCDCMAEYNRRYFAAKDANDEMLRVWNARRPVRAEHPNCEACHGMSWWGWLKREDLCEECSEELSEWMSKFSGKCRCGRNIYECHESCQGEDELYVPPRNEEDAYDTLREEVERREMGKCRCGDDLYDCRETCYEDTYVPCCMCGDDCSEGDYVRWKICSRACLTRDSRW